MSNDDSPILLHARSRRTGPRAVQALHRGSPGWRSATTTARCRRPSASRATVPRASRISDRGGKIRAKFGLASDLARPGRPRRGEEGLSSLALADQGSPTLGLPAGRAGSGSVSGSRPMEFPIHAAPRRRWRAPRPRRARGRRGPLIQFMDERSSRPGRCDERVVDRRLRGAVDPPGRRRRRGGVAAPRWAAPSASAAPAPRSTRGPRPRDATTRWRRPRRRRTVVVEMAGREDAGSCSSPRRPAPSAARWRPRAAGGGARGPAPQVLPFRRPSGPWTCPGRRSCCPGRAGGSPCEGHGERPRAARGPRRHGGAPDRAIRASRWSKLIDASTMPQRAAAPDQSSQVSSAGSSRAFVALASAARWLRRRLTPTGPRPITSVATPTRRTRAPTRSPAVPDRHLRLPSPPTYGYPVGDRGQGLQGPSGSRPGSKTREQRVPEVLWLREHGSRYSGGWTRCCSERLRDAGLLLVLGQPDRQGTPWYGLLLHRAEGLLHHLPGADPTVLSEVR